MPRKKKESDVVRMGGLDETSVRFQPLKYYADTPKTIELTDAEYDLIQLLASYGCSNPTIADNLGIKPTHFTLLLKEDPVLAHAVHAGRATGLQMVASALMENCLKGKEASIFFYLCNRAKDQWKHTSKVHDNGEGSEGKLVNAVQDLIRSMPD